MWLAKLLATCGGIGYLQKGAGTVAALFCVGFWHLARLHNAAVWMQLALTAFVFALGVVVATAVEKTWGHDSNKVVIDEWLGMCIALLMVPFSWLAYGLAFVFFRTFDIWKPLYIRKAERLPGGWGVMADDLLAGIYSALLLHLLLKTGLL